LLSVYENDSAVVPAVKSPLSSLYQQRVSCWEAADRHSAFFTTSVAPWRSLSLMISAVTQKDKNNLQTALYCYTQHLTVCCRNAGLDWHTG